ncbi:HEPN domain-containing protein [Paenibacillus sp. MSJ-6]|uniref:HEPN domain-containing protein n=1 Tax=Paenibacillus brevis TaxID=2841508 RepID=A0ABS6FS33_9BACL|nr:HEPN domain-containing protein [Paenibacillus brevis]
MIAKGDFREVDSGDTFNQLSLTTRSLRSLKLLERQECQTLDEINLKGTDKMSNNGFSFPIIMGIALEQIEFQLPKDIYIRYINVHMSDNDKNVLIKWQERESITDQEYVSLITGSFYTPNPENMNNDSVVSEGLEGLLQTFGGDIIQTEEGNKLALIEDKIPKIKATVYENILLNILKSEYSIILDELFPEYNVDLSEWKSTYEDDLQSLNTALRTAYLFTLIGYIYGGVADIYESFIDYFHCEYRKRSKLVSNIWNTRKDNRSISYLPIFDNFRNYNISDSHFIIQVINSIFTSEDIVLNDKEEIENNLIKQAEEVITYNDNDSQDLSKDILQPVITKIVNLHKAEAFLNTAKVNCENGQYDSSINRCYYSMMRALRSLLAQYGLLSDWKINSMKPDETHQKLEQTLKHEIIRKRKLLKNQFYIDFRDVKEKRLLADYSDKYLDKIICIECISKAEKFFYEIKKLIK